MLQWNAIEYLTPLEGRFTLLACYFSTDLPNALPRWLSNGETWTMKPVSFVGVARCGRTGDVLGSVSGIHLHIEKIAEASSKSPLNSRIAAHL